MNNVDVVDFSEHRSEEVISFFGRSMYLASRRDGSLPSFLLNFHNDSVNGLHDLVSITS